MTIPRRTVLLAIAVFVGSVVLTTAIGTLINAASSGQREADRARDQSRAQASIVADQRAAQTRRIDLLRDEVDDLHEQARQQAALIGRQEQAIRDLAAQVQHGGQTPVTTAVAPRRTATRTPAPKPGTTTKPASRTQPTTAPKPVTAPQPVVRPAPTTTDPGLVCRVVGILGLC